MTPEALALKFHNTYERLAPSFGYETREDTREFKPASKNGKLMIAVCGEILGDVEKKAGTFEECFAKAAGIMGFDEKTVEAMVAKISVKK